ncbi:hypothetical protein AMATHDRAFT_4961 [Amanita thiersii Skay4041]|uniref:Uncharacterized protein n=1 Tax=Amanita thiersii Skay4041 TaxID=703135 RepID=A0A2A9NJ82_9AGAR|nr:hypothetical protein AMATHDRAFT_4961 [Amanita thiersii Skay4041]
MSLVSRVAVITGAARGIGRAIALRLADDGFDLALNDIPKSSSELNTLADELRQKGRRAIPLLADVSKEVDVKALIQDTVDQLGSVDVMVANAGVASANTILDSTILPSPFLSLLFSGTYSTQPSLSAATVDEWDHVLAVNLRGVFLCYKYAIEQMIKQGRGGRVIAASSMYGKQGAAGSGAYCASKFAVRGLTQSAAKEYGKYGITVNAYAPGFINTPLLEILGDKRNLVLDREKQETALGRVGEPEDIANLVSFLASEKSSFITGSFLSY